MDWITIAWLLLSTVCFAGGEYVSKLYAIAPTVLLACIIPVIYALGSLAWLPAILRGQSLTVIGTLWNVLSMIMTIGVGMIIFHESVDRYQIAGLVCALCAILLLSR